MYQIILNNYQKKKNQSLDNNLNKIKSIQLKLIVIYLILDKEFKITENMITKIEELKKNVQEEKYIPSVIEPSFGIGRVLYAIFEHSFKMRDEKKTYFSLPPKIAPFKCSILTV